MNESELMQALRSLSTQLAPMPRADAIEARVLAEFDAGGRTPVQSRWLPAAVLAIAASLGVVGFLHDLPGRPAPPPKTDVVFTAIPYTIPPAPYERTTVVRMNVQVAALIAAGFHIPVAADASSMVAADVLLAQDGRAVAIRTLTVPIL